MRTKQSVPVGQGCKAMKTVRHTLLSIEPGRCMCHPDLFIRPCLGCGELFHTPTRQTKTCSDKCRKRVSRMRHDKMFQTVMAFANGN